jgi:hypothetical protein
VTKLNVSEPFKGEVVETLRSLFNPIGMALSRGKILRLAISGKNSVAMPTIPGLLTFENVPKYNTVGNFTLHTRDKS